MQHTDKKRRRFLIASTTVVAGTGVAFAVAPFISYMLPSARARNAGAPVVVDVSKIEPGQQITFLWRKKPIWILRRTPQILEDMQKPSHLEKLVDPNSDIISQQPEYAKNKFRSIHPEYLVVIGICTHLGCVPTLRPDIGPADLGKAWIGGYYCPCHGSKFDFAGRVFKDVPAPTNLVVPPYYFMSDTVIKVGVDPDTDH